MAVDSAETRSDPSTLSDSPEPTPDSSPLRVSLKTTLQSGVPPARIREARTPDYELAWGDGVERLDSALAGVTRTEGNLGLLMRGMKHLATGAVAVRDANTELIHELEALRSHLARGQEEEQAMRFRMSQLEQLLDVIRHESSRERAFLIEQQDLFLVEILNDHARQVGELERLVRGSTTRMTESEELAELTAQRDQAREYATRCERERDHAWQELAAAGGGDRPPASTPAMASPTAAGAPVAPAGGTSKSGATAIGAITLRPVQVPARGASEPPPSATGYSIAGPGDDSSD